VHNPATLFGRFYGCSGTRTATKRSSSAGAAGQRRDSVEGEEARSRDNGKTQQPYSSEPGRRMEAQKENFPKPEDGAHEETGLKLIMNTFSFTYFIGLNSPIHHTVTVMYCISII
jgi:hypothetical protein